MAVSPFSDGTPGASQWPIPPNHYFDYELEIGVGYAGTYFYHSHIGFQAVTAAGPLVVEGQLISLSYPFNSRREREIRAKIRKASRKCLSVYIYTFLTPIFLILSPFHNCVRPNG
jgi:hypothetical protein